MPGVIEARRVVVANDADIARVDAQARKHAQVPGGGPVREVPGQQKAEAHAFASFEAVDQTERRGSDARAGRIIGRVLQQAVVLEIIPEIVQVIPPFAAQPTAFVGHAVVIGGEGEAAIMEVVDGEFGIGQQQAPQVVVIAEAVDGSAELDARFVAELVALQLPHRVGQ